MGVESHDYGPESIGRRSMRTLILMALVLLSCASFVSADLVQMNDGRLFEGKILSDDRETLVIDAMIVGIRGKITLKKAEIEWYEEMPLPEGFFDERKSEKPRREGDQESPIQARQQHLDEEVEESIYFIEVPIVGKFNFPGGRDEPWIRPSGVERTLAYAADQGIKHVVFRIDSPGGRVDTAQEIVALMEKYGDRLEYHAVVERAISAAIWVVFASDTIHMMPNSVIGGAVPYTVDQVGDISVEEKFSSILAAELAAVAEKKGHSTVLLRAMISRGAAAYVWTDGEGRIQIASALPAEPGVRDVRALDTETTILTLTEGEAVRIGLARLAPATPEQLGQSLGISTWRRANYYGELLIRYDQTIRITRDQRGSGRLGRAMWDIYAQDPEAFIYPYDARTGQLTETAKEEWLRQAKKARKAWRELRAARIWFSRQLRKRRPNVQSVRWSGQYPPAWVEEIWARRGLETNVGRH